MKQRIRIVCVMVIAMLSLINAKAGEIETHVRMESSSFAITGARLIVDYDKIAALPYNTSSPVQLISSDGFIEFGFDETKNVFHTDNLTSIITFQYKTKDLSLTGSSLISETLKITYNKQGQYSGQNILKLSNVSSIDISSISVTTYIYYGIVGSQAVVANPADLYLEASIRSNEALLFNFSTALASTQIGYNVINLASADREMEAFWNYIPGAEEYELDYIYVDNYDAASLSAVKANNLILYDFDHDATRIVTPNQYVRIPLVYEKGTIIFRVRGVGRSLTNNYARLEGAWSNAGYEKGDIGSFRTAFPTQYYQIQNAHELDNINWSSVRTFAENGKSGIGVSYEDGVLHNRQSLAKLNTDNKLIAQASLYDWQGRPAISILPAPVAQTYFGYVQNLNKSTTGAQFDKSIFDNLGLNPSGSCSPSGPSMDPVTSTGAANYYSANNPDKENQQALVPDAQGYPYVQIDYYPDQTGRIKRQSLPGATHKLGSGREHQFFYAQPTQEELVRLFGTEVGTNDKYEKSIDVDPNGQTSVSYIDDEGRTIATALSGTSPSNLIALDDATSSATPQPILTALYNNSNDPLNNTLVLTTTFEGDPGKVQTLTYDVTVPVYTDGCLPNLCLDCIYELELSLTDDCQNEYLDGNTSLAGNQPITKLLGRYNPTSNPSATTSCPTNPGLLSFSLSSPTPFSFNPPVKGTYHLVKKLKLSTAPVQQYAQEFVQKNTCIQTLANFQQQALSTIDITDCASLDCASCSTAVTNAVAALPAGSFTQVQINELLTKCQLKCDLQNPCSSKEKLMLMHFRPNGYFGKYNGTYSSTDPFSIFNPANTLHGNLSIQPSGTNVFSYSTPPGTYPVGYTVLDPATSTQVTPNLLSAANYIGSFNDAYSQPWLKWHPEYCQLKYECDAFINALKAYSDKIQDVVSYDEACRKGLLTPMSSMLAFPNAPLACPNCAGTTLQYEPFVPANYPTGSTFFSSTDISGAANTLKGYVQNMSYSNSSSQSVSGNIYQFAMSAGRNVDISTIVGNSSQTFGNDPCTKDREWLFFKEFYLAYKNQLLQTLKTNFMAAWTASSGGCVTNFSTFPGYVKIFNDPASITSASTLLSTYAANANNPSTASSTPQAQVVQQCSTYCQSYVNSWLQDLSPCFTAISPVPTIWTSLQANLLSVCNGGCDAQDPMGASNTLTGISITVNSVPYTVFSFSDVVAAYKAQGLIQNNVNCSGYAISFPKPKGSSLTGASATASKLDACGCNTILSIRAAYQASITANSAFSCTMSESEFANANYGVNLAYFGNYACACATAKTGTGTYDFTRLSTFQNQTLVLPENLACKQCLDCGTIAAMSASFTTTFGAGNTITNVSPALATSWLNGKYNMNSTYDQWMTFINDCSVQGGGNVGNSTVQVNDISDLFNILYQKGFLIPNTPSTPYVLNSANGAAFFGLSLWTNATPPTTAPVVNVVVTASGTSALSVVLSSTTPAYNCTFVFNGTGLPTFNSSIQASFSNSFGRCDSPETNPKSYLMTLTYLNAGSPVTMTVSGSNTCFNTLAQHPNGIPIGTVKCAPYLCSNSFTIDQPVDNCMQTLINTALNAAQTQYTNYLNQQVSQFIANYKNYCYANVTESAKRGYTVNEYHYTLYYYDRAGNLVHTVPPKGVDVMTNATDIANAVTYVQTGGGTGTPFYPKHSINPSTPGSGTPPLNAAIDGVNRYITNYEYNTFDAPLVEVSPDGGETKYYYDYVGRLVMSQNAKQLADKSYSYTQYDVFGRITEVGVLYLSASPTDLLTTAILKDPAQLKTFITSASHTRKEVTQSFYDVPLSTAVNALFTGGQINLRERVSATTYEKVFDNTTTTYDYATFYSYDDHGNVDHLIQDNPVLNSSGALNRYKFMDYEYELISGNVKKVSYQKGQRDQYFHKYEYDADNRLHAVYTSNNDQVYSRDAKYFYYQHGPMARMETGSLQVQGTDYAYTIQGWVKGVNSNILSEQTDIGKDGNKNNAYLSSNNGIHQNFAKDAASYSLNYFKGDYNPIKAASQNFLADMTNLNLSAGGVGFKQGADAPDLYNGNIASMVTSIFDINPVSVNLGMAKPQITGYRYDQLQRIKAMKAYSSINFTGDEAIDLGANAWKTPTAQNYVGIYEMSLSYDKNGNIQTLNRKGDASVSGTVWTAKQMDQLSYTYKTTAGTYIPSLNKTIDVNNQLRQVNDGTAAAYDAAYVNNYVGTDIDNQTNVDNYKYNPIGSLQSDVSEQIGLITWTAAKKVKSVERTTGSTKPDLYFEYNALGQRVSKMVVPRPSGTQDVANAVTTYYVLDASGNQLATYTSGPPARAGDPRTLVCSEHMLFGSSRLGIDHITTEMLATVTPVSKTETVYGMKDFECTNHLGNVISTISDRKIAVANANASVIYNEAFNTAGSIANWSVAAAAQYPATSISWQSGGFLRLQTANQNGNAFTVIPVQQGLQYTLQFNASFTATAPQFILFAQNGSVFTTIVFQNVVAGSNTYVFTALPGTNYFEVHESGVPSGTSVIDIDNITITAFPGQIVDYNKPDIRSTADYYAFGQSMPGRTYNAPSYKYGMNGQEKDDEIFQGALSAEYWEYDSRTGRRWEKDPIVKIWESPYATFANNPIWCSDVNGLDPKPKHKTKGGKGDDKNKKRSKTGSKDKADENGKDKTKDKGKPKGTGTENDPIYDKGDITTYGHDIPDVDVNGNDGNVGVLNPGSTNKSPKLLSIPTRQTQVQKPNSNNGKESYSPDFFGWFGKTADKIFAYMTGNDDDKESNKKKYDQRGGFNFYSKTWGSDEFATRMRAKYEKDVESVEIDWLLTYISFGLKTPGSASSTDIPSAATDASSIAQESIFSPIFAPSDSPQIRPVNGDTIIKQTTEGMKDTLYMTYSKQDYRSNGGKATPKSINLGKAKLK